MSCRSSLGDFPVVLILLVVGACGLLWGVVWYFWFSVAYFPWVV